MSMLLLWGLVCMVCIVESVAAKNLEQSWICCKYPKLLVLPRAWASMHEKLNYNLNVRAHSKRGKMAPNRVYRVHLTCCILLAVERVSLQTLICGHHFYFICELEL